MALRKKRDEENAAKEEEEEEELFVGDLVKISGVKADVSKAMGDLGLQWEASMSAFLGQNARVKSVQMKEGKQLVEVQLGTGADGPSFTTGVAALELLGDEEEEDEEDVEADQNEEEEAEEGHMYRVNEKVRDLTKPKGKCATGIVTKVADQGTCDVKYDDGSTRTGIPLKQLRPLEQAESDGTGLSYTSSHNEFDFTTGQLPTGVEAVGEGVELKAGRGGETYLVMRKGTYLRLPFKGMRHERLRPGEAIPSYTLTLELQLDGQHPQLEHPWSVYQASFPEVHETDELCFVAKARTEFPQWMVGTDIDGRLPVTLEMDPKSKALAGLLPGTVLQQCGEVVRLPSGARRVPVKFKRQALTAVEEEEVTSKKKATSAFKAPPPAPGSLDPGKGTFNFDLFKGQDEEEEEDPGDEASRFGHKMNEDEVNVTLHAGYWGESTQGCATTFKVSSNGIQRTLTFFPGIEHGAVRVEGEPDADLGFKPAPHRYHILSLTMRQTGTHTFSISDGADPTNVWSSDFRLHGWLDDLYGAAAVSVFDPEDRELELGHEMVYQAEGEHKLRLVTLGDQVFETDELDPQGWVSFNRTCLEPVDKANTKASRHPTCHVKVKDKILEKRLYPGRWHSLTVTVDSVRDEMCVYLDGLAVDKPIDIFESFGMGRPTGGGREGGRERRKGVAEGPSASAEYEAYSYGGFGYSFQSPFAVPQEGFLLFASSSIRSMPGGTKLRKAIFRNSILNGKAIEDQYVSSRHKRRPPQIPQSLTLAPIMKKKAIPLWIHGSYVAEFCNPFVPAAGGSPQHLYGVFCMALEATVETMTVGKLWSQSDINGCKKVLGLFRDMDLLMRKWHQLWTCGSADQLPGLSAIYLRRLAQARAELQPGGRLLVPLGIRLQKDAQMLMLIVERKASGNYRFLVVNSSPIGLAYHASDAGTPPKIRYRTALELDDIPAIRAEDEGFWMMLVVTAVQPCSDLHLYDKLLPWLAGSPLEHLLATVAPSTGATQEWRSRQCAATDGWRYLTFTLRVLLLEVAQFTTSKAKLLKWHMREQLLSFASNDLAQAQSLSVSEKRLIRLGLSQLALAAVKVSGNLELEGSKGALQDAKETSMTVLNRAQGVVTEVEAAIERKPRPYGFEDPSVLPLLDLVGGAEEAPAHDWGLHPFFERLLREQRSPGQKVGIPLLVPINLLEMPETIPDLEAAVRALRLTEELCAKLCFVGHERCKFSNFLRVALLQHVFTELMPLPLGPLAEKAPLNLTDPVWAPNGFDKLHPQLTRGGQLELLQVLLRLCEHFVSASCGLHASGSFDGVKIVVLGGIAAIADRVLRIRTVLPGIPKPRNDGPIEAEAEPNPSLVSDLINGVGNKGWKPMAVDATSFMRQSETIEATTPEISVARTAVASYFSEVKKSLQVPSGKDQTLFEWDQHGWMLWTNKETGLKKLVQTICSHHLLQAGAGWAELAAGSDPYLVHTWPEFQCYRDIIFYWKYFLCTDLRVFPKVTEFPPQSAYLRWQVVDEQKAFGCPPNRGKVFMITALGKDHLVKHDVPPHRPKPAASGLRWPSAALPSHHTKTPVRTEDDLLYMRSLPTFNEMLRASDSEALLSFLTVPYIRMPLVLAFFTTGDRVNSLFDNGLQEILQAVILEPGKLLEPMNWSAAPENVPANSSAEQELVASPYGQLLTELACAPGCLLAYLAKLLELALVLANSAMSQTVDTILFTLRVAARVESSAVYLLQHADGKLPATGPRPGALPSSAALLAELRAGRQRLRAIFMEAEGWLDSWLDELHDLACKAAAAAGEDAAGGGAKAKNKAAQSLDQYMKTSCNIHAHLLLLLRNVPEEELDERSVSRILSSFTFLSLHHTFNQNFLDIPETELFEVFQHHRRGLVRWFEKQRKNSEYGKFNRVLRQVHQQFSTIDSSSAVDTGLFEWGVVKGDASNAGRYAIVGPKRSDAERGEVAATASNDNAWIELNIQLLQVTVRGRHVTPLEADTCDDGDFQEVLNNGAGRKAETVQCAALLSTNLVRVRELLSQPYRITRWEGMAAANLPFTGDYVRLYDMEDFEEHEAWVPQLFEPVRLKFFVPPAVPQNILFFLLEETDPSASVIVLAAVHPKVRGKVWKEVVVFRDLRAVQIFKIDSYGHQHYRSLEYTTNARYCLAEKQPSPNDRDDPWPDWGRYEAGAPDLNLQDKPPSVVMSRTIVKDVHSDGGAGAGTGKKDPLDDDAEWSDGEPSDDETEQERKERTVWERSQKEGEQYLPKRLLKGLLPEGLLEKYFIYQENETPWRAIRGYPKTLEGEEDRDPDHILEIKLIKVGKVPATGHRGWCALVRKRWKAAGRKPWFLLNLLYAKEGTPLHSMARTLVRLENLSFILAWTEQDPRIPGASGGYDPPIHFVEMPRLLLSFTVRRGADGTRSLWSLDHAELSVPLGPPTAARSQAAKLLEPMPHSLLLQTSNQQYFALLPNIKVHRPHVGTDPFSTELVLERGNADWWGRAKNKTFLYPVHASRSFLQTPTLASALYVMMLRWMNRDYGGVAALVSAIGTDSKYEDDEMQVFKHLGRITDPHPDSHANRLQVSLAVADASMELPWDLLEESAGYLGKIAHVTARSRLSEDYELRVLQLCKQIRKCLEIIEGEVGVLRQRWWGQWGAARIKRFVELLQDEKERKLANFQEAQEVEQWLRQLLRKMRAAQLPQTKDEIRSMAISVFGDYSVDEHVELALDNRSKYLERLGGRDGARPGEDLYLHCPHRAKESMWQTHQDQNVLLCSLFDLLWEVLGAEKVLRRDVEEEEGPEIPMMRRLPFPMAITTAFEMLQGKMSLKDYGSAAKTWAFLYSLFTCSTGARLSRAKETAASHQHTYSTLLLHLMPGSRHHGVLASLLHILAQNPNICEAMPMLTKPKKVRLVGQWKLKLTEIHQFVVQAADAMQLAWPPAPESFQELPRPMQSRVDEGWFQRPEQKQGGLCSRLLFAPEIPKEGACLLGCPSLAVLNCTERWLEGTADMSSAEVEALATTPLRHLAEQHLVETPPSSLLPEEMPFDLVNHPTAKHRVAISMLSRLEREVKLCARMRNARQKPTLTFLQGHMVKAIANGDVAALTQAREQMKKLRGELLALKEKDEEFVAMAINKSFADANDIDLSPAVPSGAPLRDRLRFWLLRYSDLEATLWFEHLCCGLLSPEAESDFSKLNPFLEPKATAGLLSRLTQMMLVAGRIIQTCRALDSCQDLSDLLSNPDAAGSAVALAAGLGEKANVLSGLLASKRTYIEKAEGATQFKGVFDPHYLVFEFVTGFLLRPRQVEMVNEFSDALRSGKSSVKQMIMGAGKTSVVSPLLALMHANGSRIVCLVVPPALISLSRSVLQNCFSTVVQKRVSTFKCDRSLDLEVALSERLGRIVSHGDVLLTTPGDVKSLELRFLEQLDLANDRQARRNTTQMRRECVQMGRALELMKKGVCMIDEVDLVLHPLRSELNFPIGPKNLIEHAPDRWRVVLHLLDGFFSVEKGRVPPHLKDSLRAKEILQVLGEVIHRGADSRYLQRNPHLILLNEEFYHNEVKPIMCDWLMLWLSSEHVGRAFEQASSNREDRGLSEDEVRAYVLHRVTPQRFELEAPMEVWQGAIARAGGGSAVARSSCAWIIDVLNGSIGVRSGPGRLELPRPDGAGAAGAKFEPVARSTYMATRVEALKSSNIRLILEETEEGAAMRGERVEKLPPKDAKSMNLSWDWLQVYLPFSLQKIDRVTFGIMSSEQVAAALAEQPLMPLTRAKLAIPFVGKDVPSQSSEFAHPDVVIGLTTFAYRYEGLRREDFDEVLGMLCDRLEGESGAVLERPTSLLWKNWVEESGADFCVKQAELDEQTSSQVLGLEEGGKTQKPDRLRPRVLPLHLLERRNEANMSQLFELLRKLPSAVHFYLEQSVFPQFMRFQDEKLSASGQDLGGSILFGQRIGFSGTPSDLMPRELGQCDYEPGSEGEMVSTMTDTKVVTFEAIPPGWNVELLLDSIIEASHQGRCNALIDTGALITGLTNQEVAEYLLGFGSRERSGDGSPRSPPSLPDTVDGVVFLDEDGGKKILLRQTREVTKLADSGVPAQRRFAFYDQVHTTGMDIQHKLDAVAALTLGKDMCWRDYVQGAYRMRGIGRGQRICLYVIPEVVELISRDLVLAGIEEKLHGSDGKWTTCERGRLLAVAAWLLVNSIRTERIQFAMLQLQNLSNVWRRNAFKTVMQGFEMVTSEGLKDAVQVFKEPIAFTLPSGVPKARGVHEVVQDRVEEMSSLIAGEEDEQAVAEVKKNVLELSALADEKEGEAGLDTEQQREQEQERQQEQEQEEEKEQEIEIEKFVDLMHCRDDEEPESWPLISLASEEKARQFYEAQRFKLWKRRPLENLPGEARISTNWFNPQWSGFRRVKNVFVQMEWTPDLGKAVRCKEPLQLDTVEELEMHKKLRAAWDLLMRGEGIELPREQALMEPQREMTHGKKLEKIPPPPGELGAERLMELLAASFDWDASLRDPSAALAYLGRKPEEKLDYEDMVRLLLDARFRTRDEGRCFVLLSLAEAETLRRVLHARLQEKEPILKQAPSTSLALRCVFAGNAVLDGSQGFQAGPTFQCRMMHQLARFLDGQSFFRPPEISVLLRALQRNRPFERRRFFEGLGGCRRRGASGGWEQQPVAEVLRPWLEFEQVLARVRAVRLHAAIYGQGLSVQMAFQRFDVNQSGLLEPMELCRALRELGFAFDAFEVANWIEAVDTTGNHCADYSEFFAFCKLQVDSLLGIGFAPKAALGADATALVADRPSSAEVAEADSTRPLSTSPKSANPKPATAPELIRHTSDIVRPDEIEEELLERRAAQKRQEAEEARAKAEVEEAIEVLVEEELGMNPTFGEGFGEWDFRGQLLPKDTFALGVVDLIPESWGTKGGKNFLLFDQRAGLAVQRIQLAPNGNSDRRINKYSLTLWFRTPYLPSKADRMLLLDLPRGEMESEEETATSGSSSVFVWRGGVVAPEGYHEPSLQKKDSDASSHLRQMMNGEWRLKFQGGENNEKEKKVEMLLSMEPSGRLLLSPSRGAASRKTDAATRNCFGVRVKLQKEIRDYVELHCNNVPPQDYQPMLDNFWNKIRGCCNVAMEGRSWAEIGWPGSQNQVKRRALKDLKSRGEVMIARGLSALDALRIARTLKEQTDGGAEFVEDKSMANEIKIGDMVQLVQKPNQELLFGNPFSFGGFLGLEHGEAGKVTNVNLSRGQVHVEAKKGNRWYPEDDVMKVDPKALGLVPLTDSEWAGLPSTRANYVSFSQQLPNPLLEGGWVGKGRAEKAEETSDAEIDLNFDVVQMGFMSSYVDAKVFYAEAGLEIRGEWRTADGTTGTLSGTKALAGLALGGLWHLELQSGADSMQHAWNCWFSSFPPSSGSNTSSIQVSGSALAGPMLQEGSAPENAPPALHMTGEMTGKGLVSFTMKAHDVDLPQLEGLGAKNWIDSTWEGELGSDRWLRGSWRSSSSRDVGARGTLGVRRCIRP